MKKSIDCLELDLIVVSQPMRTVPMPTMSIASLWKGMLFFKHKLKTIFNSLRLHPPVISAFRLASKTTTLGKFTIPKNTIVEIDLSNVGWKDSKWENPMEFNPERMPMDRIEREKIQNDFTWTPFSMGQRKCIGWKFALFEIYVVLVKILQSYKIELLNDLNDPQDAVGYVAGPTVGPGNLKLLFVKRQ